MAKICFVPKKNEKTIKKRTTIGITGELKEQFDSVREIHNGRLETDSQVLYKLIENFKKL